MSKRTIFIEGMQCNHCKMKVEKALKLIDGIEKVEVKLEYNKAIIEESKNVEDNKIKKIIEEEGYKVREIKQGE